MMKALQKDRQNMHRYRVGHKIWTVAELYDPQTIEGFEVRLTPALTPVPG